MASQSFTVQGNTVALNVTTTAHAAVQAPSANGIGAMQYQLYNDGPNTVFVAVSNNSSVAAVIPVDGTPANAFPIDVGTRIIVTGPPNAWFSAISQATKSGTLYITPGEGRS